MERTPPTTGSQIVETIQHICSFSPRQGEGETRTADYLIWELQKQRFTLSIQEYETVVPIVRTARLRVNDQTFEAPHVEGCSMTSGDIEGRIAFEDSTHPSASLGSLFSSVIANNPHCKAASQATFYDIPAVAVTKDVLEMARAAYWDRGRVDGYVDIERKQHRGRNLIIGNTKAADVLCLTHYDCLKKGAFDNASGVAVLLHAMTRVRNDLDRILIAFCGTEEVCCELGHYGGRGYAALRTEYPEVFERVQKIVVVDSVGNVEPSVLKGAEDSTCYSALPISSFGEVRHKVHLVFGNMEGLMSVYHSDDDDGRNLSEAHLEQCVNVVCSQLIP